MIPLRRFAAGPRDADRPDGARPCGFSLGGSDAVKLEQADASENRLVTLAPGEPGG
jgi:hypothetical protein